MPPVVIKYFKEMLEGENADDSRCFIESTIISSILGYCVLLPYSIWQITQRFPEAKAVSDVKFNYTVIIILLLSYPVLIFLYVCWLSKRKYLNDLLVNVYSNCLCCCKNPMRTFLFVFYCIGLTALVCMLQMIAIYATYSIVVVASLIVPVVQSVLFVALWLLMVCNILTLITILLGCKNKRISHGTCVAVALLVFFTLVLCLSIAALMSLTNMGGSIQIGYAAIWSLINTIILIAKKKKFILKILSYSFSTPALT